MGTAAAGVERRGEVTPVRCFLLALGCAALIASAPATARASTCTDAYIGPSGGSWANAANWSSGLPGAGTVVCWSATSTVVVDEGAQQADSISSGGSLIVKGEGRLALLGSEAHSALNGQLQTLEGGFLRLASTVECAGAQLGGGTLEDDAAIDCQLTILHGARLTGTGTVLADVLNEGIVEPGDPLLQGDLRIGGEYTQASSGALVTRAVTPSAAGADTLDVAGAMHLAGTISLQLGFVGAAGQTLPVLRSQSAPQGAFSSVVGSTGGTPWTVEYGPSGVIARSTLTTLLHPLIIGHPEVGSTVGCGLGEWTPDPSTITYGWLQPVRFLAASRPSGSFEEPPTEEELFAVLMRTTGPQLLVPGVAVHSEIACSARAKIPVAGSTAVTSIDERAESPFVRINSELVNTGLPKIVGTPAPGQRLSCTFGQWNGLISGFAYRWSGGASTSTTAEYRVGRADEGRRLICTVYVRYKSTAIPASSQALEIPPRPQPTLCPRRPLALVSARTSGAKVLLFGAASQSYIGVPVTAFGPHERAIGRVGPSGYVEIALPRRGDGAGSYSLALGTTRSQELRLPGVLQILSDHSDPGRSEVVLRLAKSVRRGAKLSLSHLRGCTPVRVATSRLGPGGTYTVNLTARRGAGAAPYRASVRVSGRIYSVELIVPPRPTVRELP